MFIILVGLCSATLLPLIGQSQTYRIVDGGQILCYDTAKVIPLPLQGQPFYGQDAQYIGNRRSYTLSGDGKTVLDNITGLTWMRGPNITNTPPVTVSPGRGIERLFTTMSAFTLPSTTFA